MTTSEVPLQSLDRALTVLDLFLDERELGVREVARKTGWNTTTCHRILTTYAQREYLVQDDITRRFRIGSRVLALASGQAPMTREDKVGKEMRRLRDITGESIGLHEPVGGWRVCVYQVESQRELRWATSVGHPIPVLWGASDRIFRAFCGAEAIARFDHVVDELTLSGKYIPTPGENRDVLAARNAGWAATGQSDTRTPGAAAVAAPIFFGGDVLTLTVIGPEIRMREQSVIEAIVPELLASAAALSDSWPLPVENAALNGRN